MMAMKWVGLAIKHIVVGCTGGGGGYVQAKVNSENDFGGELCKFSWGWGGATQDPWGSVEGYFKFKLNLTAFIRPVTHVSTHSFCWSVLHSHQTPLGFLWQASSWGGGVVQQIFTRIFPLGNSIAFGKAPRRETKSPGLHGPSGHYVGGHEC